MYRYMDRPGWTTDEVRIYWDGPDRYRRIDRYRANLRVHLPGLWSPFRRAGIHVRLLGGPRAVVPGVRIEEDGAAVLIDQRHDRIAAILRFIRWVRPRGVHVSALSAAQVGRISIRRGPVTRPALFLYPLESPWDHRPTARSDWRAASRLPMLQRNSGTSRST